MRSGTATDRVAANVRAEMARRSRKQSEFAKSLGLSQAALYRRLSGQIAFNVSELERIATELGIPLASLIGEAAA